MEYREARFEINNILPIGLTLIVTGIGVAYGLNVLGDTRDDFIADQTLTATCNTTHNGGDGDVISGCGNETYAMTESIDGVAKLPEKFPLIVNVVIAAIIIGILIRYLMVRYG